MRILLAGWPLSERNAVVEALSQVVQFEARTPPDSYEHWREVIDYLKPTVAAVWIRDLQDLAGVVAMCRAIIDNEAHLLIVLSELNLEPLLGFSDRWEHERIEELRQENKLFILGQEAEDVGKAATRIELVLDRADKVDLWSI